MDDVFRVMSDVAGLITRGSDVARMEVRRVAAEGEHRVAVHTTADVGQPVTAATPATELRLKLFYKWLKIAFRSP